MVLDILACIFLALGCFAGLTGSVGILRMPDFYTRLHPAGKSDTLTQLFIVTGILLQSDAHTAAPPWPT